MWARGRVALVTGGTRGIGLGVCRSLAREGWGLALCGVRPDDAVHDVLSELRRSGGPVEYIQADVASAAIACASSSRCSRAWAPSMRS